MRVARQVGSEAARVMGQLIDVRIRAAAGARPMQKYQLIHKVVTRIAAPSAGSRPNVQVERVETGWVAGILGVATRSVKENPCLSYQTSWLPVPA